MDHGRGLRAFVLVSPSPRAFALVSPSPRRLVIWDCAGRLAASLGPSVLWLQQRVLCECVVFGCVL